jgi:hypothetical protein
MSSCCVRPRSSPVFALSIHADYACRHSGACCSAGWTIPVEPHGRPLLEPVMTATVLRVEAARACRDRGGRLTGPRLLEAFRAEDRLLMHLADRQALTGWLGRVER